MCLLQRSCHFVFVARPLLLILMLACGLCQFYKSYARAAFTVWFRGSWLGALVSAQCCVASIAHRVRYGSFCDSNPCDDTRLSPFYQLLTLRIERPFTLLFLFCLVFAWAVLVWFCLFWFAVLVFSVCSFHRHRDGLLDCVLVLCQFGFYSHLLWRWITSLI